MCRTLAAIAGSRLFSLTGSPYRLTEWRNDVLCRSCIVREVDSSVLADPLTLSLSRDGERGRKMGFSPQVPSGCEEGEVGVRREIRE